MCGILEIRVRNWMRAQCECEGSVYSMRCCVPMMGKSVCVNPLIKMHGMNMYHLSQCNRIWLIFWFIRQSPPHLINRRKKNDSFIKRLASFSVVVAPFMKSFWTWWNWLFGYKWRMYIDRQCAILLRSLRTFFCVSICTYL